MAQSLATIMFTAALLIAGGLITMLLLGEWNAVRRALGLVSTPRGTITSRIRAVPARRAVMVRLVPAALRHAA